MISWTWSGYDPHVLAEETNNSLATQLLVAFRLTEKDDTVKNLHPTIEE